MSNKQENETRGVIILNGDGVISYIGSRLCHQLGVVRRTLVGKGLDRLISSTSSGFYQASIYPMMRQGLGVGKIYLPFVGLHGEEISMLVSCEARTHRKGLRQVCTCSAICPTTEYEKALELSQNEVRLVSAEKNDLLAKLNDAYSVLSAQTMAWKKFKEELGSLADHDILTGLVNRRGFEVRLEEDYVAFAKHKIPFSILLIDIDHFKVVNDTYGHLVGDSVLKGIADLLTSAVRKLDLAARWGGEEFVVLLPESDREASLLAAERIREATESYDLNGIKVTVSIGATTCGHGKLPCRDLMKDVDQALYVAKNSGKNQVVHSADEQTHVNHRRKVFVKKSADLI